MEEVGGSSIGEAHVQVFLGRGRKRILQTLEHSVLIGIAFRHPPNRRRDAEAELEGARERLTRSEAGRERRLQHTE